MVSGRMFLWTKSQVYDTVSSYGSVYLERCHQHEGRARAVKEIKKSVVSGQELDYARELEAIVKFSNPKHAHCFVRSDSWFELDDAVFIVMEFLGLGDLQRYLSRPLPEREARQILGHVLEGLGYMHDNGFVHRDLKSGNIMVVSGGPDWFVKISDFGISKRRQQDVTTLQTLQRGILGFAAPEAHGFSRDNSVSTYSFSVDLWSLGAVAYKMLTNTNPFESFPSLLLKECGVFDCGQELILKLMSPLPADRPTAALAARHSWMTMDIKAVVRDLPENGPLVHSDCATTTSVASKAWTLVGTSTSDPLVGRLQK
ncbi:kinase-like domain-containing protein [Podospora didyma]|uniref:Kinase-like domain-containing protein n=1 Tax=Podospora didyma TaxID=330526 RepID=A0AAE0TZJ2_9PEZI|nr:kinase-like domain-containing protein [Podospora didyma]